MDGAIRWRPQHVPPLLDFLAKHGASWEMDDPDGDVLSVDARDISRDEILAFLQAHGDALRTRMFFEARQRMRVCIGGPLAGKSHGFWPKQCILEHVARGKWAAYHVASDGRAWFKGWATSRKKARSLAYAK